jgi:hypothetical protein
MNDMNDMDDNTTDLEPSDEYILAAEVSDEALEAVASTTTRAAMTIGAPTFSILVACC